MFAHRINSNPLQHPRRPRRVLTTVLLTALVALTAACGIGEQGTANPGYVSRDGSVSTWEPDHRSVSVTVTGTDFNGEEIDSSTMLGDVIVINTWYANCPPCRVEAPDLARIATERADQNVQFFGINGVDEAGSAHAFERTYGIPYPSIEDSRGRAIASLEGVVPLQAVPTTIILDTKGRVAASILGVITPTTVETIIDDLLAEAE